ncbi:MAG: sugar phosphate isomerase/epimerase [Acidobacteria bacterium]|nr:sugar phosphate isomerase/epimerase [Acidobacteriota bacterium]
MTRRDCLTLGSSLVISSRQSPASASAGALLIGAPVFLKSDDPAELAREHRRVGYSAAYCPPVRIGEKEKLRAIEAAFQKERVVIAEVGAWKNLLDVDPLKRKENFDYVVERMAIADEVGARCCVDISGSYNEKYWYGPHPKNMFKEGFDATVENCRRILDAVKPKRSFFTLEVMGWTYPDTPDSYLRLMKAIDRKGFAVHLDVCNAVNSPDKFYNNAALIEECFRKLGPHIKSCHAKDLEWVVELNVHFLEVIPGRGQLDYRAYLNGLRGLKSPVPLMLEHLKTAEEYKQGFDYIRKIAGEMNYPLA